MRSRKDPATSTTRERAPSRGASKLRRVDRDDDDRPVAEWPKAGPGSALDLMLVLDSRGIICDVAAQIGPALGEHTKGWIGAAWADWVAAESRTTIRKMLKDAAHGRHARWQPVTHRTALGVDLPTTCSAVPIGLTGYVVVVGYGQRTQTMLRQRLVEAQIALERDALHLRQVEARFQLLIRACREAIVIVDAAQGSIVDANPAAISLLGLPSKPFGHAFPAGLPDKVARAVAMLLAKVLRTGRADEIGLRGSPRRPALTARAALYKQGEKPMLLVTLANAGASNASHTGSGESHESALRAIEHSPDGFVVTDLEGRILSANASFVELVELVREDQLRGESLERWIGRPELCMPLMLSTLRQQGELRLFATCLRGELGAQVQVEISARTVPDSEPPCIGFSVRHIGRRLAAEPRPVQSAPGTAEELTRRVGRKPLKDLVRESTDVIERLCIEKALVLTGDNRAAAAGMLGLSRQGLYAKLHRYSLAERGAKHITD